MCAFVIKHTYKTPIIILSLSSPKNKWYEEENIELNENAATFSTSEEKERAAIELLQKRNLIVKPILHGYQIKNNAGVGSQVFHRQELAAINRLGDISFIEFDKSDNTLSKILSIKDLFVSNYV
jgi:hypothetical protein